MRNLECLIILAALLVLSYSSSFAGEAVMRWEFSPKYLRNSQLKAAAGNFSGVLEKASRFDNNIFILKSDQSIEVKGDIKANLPQKEFTVGAQVMITKGTKYGGIIGYFQDNGAYEKGWLLGYNNSNFLMQVSTGKKLFTVKSQKPFVKNKWYYLTGVYDGKEMRLYVDGVLAGKSSAAQGKIDYPPEAFFTIGAYRDKNEFYRMHGKLASVVLFNSVLTNVQIADFAKSDQVDLKLPQILAGTPPSKSPSPSTKLPEILTGSPYAKFLSPSTCKIIVSADIEGKYSLEYGLKGIIDKKAEFSGKKPVVSAILKDLNPHSVYEYRVVCDSNGKRHVSKVFELDTNQNYAVPSAADLNSEIIIDKPSHELAKKLLKNAGFNNGYCLVYGISTGKLAVVIANESKMTVIGVDNDEELINKARKMLYQQGLYGSRVNLMHVKNMNKLPFVNNSFNMIVSEKKINSSSSVLMNLLVPGKRGALFLNKQKCIRKPAPKGAGDWTHQYGNPGNTAYCGETLAGAKAATDFELQWVGKPGADFGLDRNPRMPAPLAVNGRLFHQGMNRMIALDVYNGTILWSLEIGDLRRVNIPRDCSNWCADKDYVYTAINNSLWKIDAKTGIRKAEFLLPGKKGSDHNWGYVGLAGNNVIGSCEKKGSGYREFWTKKRWYDGIRGYGTEKVCSDEIFAVDKNNGRQVWKYSKGIIINPSVGIWNNTLYFVESRNPEIMTLSTGNIGSAALWKDLFLVGIDCKNGKISINRKLNIAPGTVVFYLQVSAKGILLTSSGKKYHFYCFEPDNGEKRWEAEQAWLKSNHGFHMQHPVIIEDTVYLEPNGYDMANGKIITKKVGKHSGCATYSGSKYALFYRGSGRQIAVWDAETEKISTWNKLRPSCWLSFVPSQGMLLIPEGGGGCSCGGWMETSMGFSPKRSK